MGSLARFRILALGLALGCAAGPRIASAYEVAAALAPDRLVIHDAAETLRDYCSSAAAGVLWLTLPGGQRYELITSTTDAAVANPGDGEFHAFERRVVEAAIASVRYPIANLGVEIFLLPYPRRSGLESAAGPGIILLSPGVYPVSPEHQHAQFVHELGHVVQYERMPDSATEAWERYRALRQITDVSTYSASSEHANRPHEIFAEDFRALFGGALATYSGSIENGALAPPSSVSGLESFLLGLVEVPAVRTLAAWPNPARAGATFSSRTRTSAPLDLFDAAGRRIATLAPAAAPGGVRWTWQGRDDRGLPVAPGVLLARVRETGGDTFRLVIAR